MSNHTEHSIGSEDKIQTAEEIAAELEAESPTESTADRPEWLPEKFESPEAMAEAYKNLETKLGEPKAEPEGDAGLTIKAAEEAAEKAGVDLDGLTTKFRENGSLEDSDYESLEKSGFTRDQVDKYIAGQQALVSQYEAKVFEQAGDKGQYEAMTAWAAQNLSEGQIDLFNEAVESGDVERAMFAINGLKAQYVSANGQEPARQIDGQPSTGGARYESEAEWVSDCQDPRYWSDQGYREKVERKFNNTFGNAA